MQSMMDTTAGQPLLNLQMREDPFFSAVPVEEQVFAARIDRDKLKPYMFFMATWWLFWMICTIPLIPFFLCFGWTVISAYVARFQVLLTTKSIRIKRGLINRQEKLLLLDKIQDVSIEEGCFQRCFGVCTIKIQTAGAATPKGEAEGNITGIVDARAFRDLILAQKVALCEGHPGGLYQGDVRVAMPAQGGKAAEMPTTVLAEIRDSVKHMEEIMVQKAS